MPLDPATQLTWALPNRRAETRVVVAMSGGVDSSVVAAQSGRGRLRRRGRDPAAL